MATHVKLRYRAGVKTKALQYDQTNGIKVIGYHSGRFDLYKADTEFVYEWQATELDYAWEAWMVAAIVVNRLEYGIPFITEVEHVTNEIEVIP